MRSDQAGSDPELQEKVSLPNDHDIELEADRSGNTVTITCVNGDPGPTLKKNSGAHRFKFTLTDNTDVSVSFSSLDREDGSTACPPKSGDNSSQIPPGSIQIGTTAAAFTDSNSGGPTNVSYQWNFTCSDSKVTVKPYDPIIKNGGS